MPTILQSIDRSIGFATGGPPALAGLDWPALTKWFAASSGHGTAPLRTARLLNGGLSNLTFALEDDAGGQWCLRRPPIGPTLESAHDVTREHRILQALTDSDIPIPRPIALCEDTSVLGAPFYVMELVEGTVCDRAEVANTMPADARARAGIALVEALATVHDFDFKRSALADLGRPQGYLQRQRRRWLRQLGPAGLSERPRFRSIADRLAAAEPRQQRDALVHGDVKLGNAILHATGEVAALLDWELTTIGDPLADVGVLLASWSHTDEQVPRVVTPPSTVRGFVSRGELVEAYRQRARLDVGAIDYYTAFAEWRWAAINVGIHMRSAAGQLPEAVDLEILDAETESRLDHAEELLG